MDIAITGFYYISEKPKFKVNYYKLDNFSSPFPIALAPPSFISFILL